MSQGPTVTVRQVGPSTGRGEVRGHTILVDRPEANGGMDQGPMGGELILVGLGGCFMSNLLAAIRERNAPVTGVKVRVSAIPDGTPARLTNFAINVSAQSDDPAQLDKLTTIAARGCIAVRTLSQGSPISVRVASAGTA